MSLLVSAPAMAQVAPPLGIAQQFGILGNSAVTGATGTGVSVSGDVGSSPTASISNFPPSATVSPYIVHYANDGVVQQAHLDAIAAYNALVAQGTGTVLADNLATVGALTPGIYSFTTGTPDLPASATLTLNDPTGTGIFIFNVANALTTNVLSNVVGTANPCNIYWRVGTSATLNGATFRGNVIADASITVGAGANLTGRALAGTGATGAVTVAGSGGNTIGGCSAVVTAPVVVPLVGGVSLSKAFSPASIGPGAGSTLLITLGNGSATAVTLTSNLVDNLPSGMTTVGSAATTCGGAPPTVTASSVTLPIGATIPGGTMPGGGACTVSVSVTSAVGGSHANTLGVGALQTDATIPGNPAAASATLIVTAATAIPTLSEWGMMLLGAFIGITGIAAMRRKAR